MTEAIKTNRVTRKVFYTIAHNEQVLAHVQTKVHFNASSYEDSVYDIMRNDYAQAQNIINALFSQQFVYFTIEFTDSELLQVNYVHVFYLLCELLYA